MRDGYPVQYRQPSKHSRWPPKYRQPSEFDSHASGNRTKNRKRLSHERYRQWHLRATRPGGAQGVREERGQVRAVNGVDLDVTAGETVAITGPSGGGKSTLLYLLGGMDRPTSGDIWLAGQRLGEASERGLARLRRDAIGFVFQAFHLMNQQAVSAELIPVNGRSRESAGRAFAVWRGCQEHIITHGAFKSGQPWAT
jgi:ABC-type glutathione transport system ATPase component